MKIKAVIFDMDGLMFDTERLWLIGVKRTNEKYNTNVPIKLIKECIGLRNDKIDLKIKEHMGENFDTTKFRQLNSVFMNEEVEKNGLKKKKGLLKLIKFLKSKNIPMAIASSSSLEKIKKRFNQAKVDMNYFKVVESGEMVHNPKPNPEIYINACELLGFKPSECLALEDSDNGIKSAASAGCKAILIPDVKKPSVEVEKLAYKKFKSLDEVITLFE